MKKEERKMIADRCATGSASASFGLGANAELSQIRVDRIKPDVASTVVPTLAEPVAHCVLLVVVVALGFVAGCNSASDASSERVATIEISTGESVDVEWEGNRAISVRTAGGESIRFINGEADVGEQLVIQLSTGKVEVFRKPNTVVAEFNMLAHLYLKEGSLEELITDGFQGEPYIGPNRALYWTARRCANPSCNSQSMAGDERPYLFISRMPGVSVSDSGAATSVEAMPGSYLIPCPVCKKFEHVVQYDLPATASRKSELVDELDNVRAARDVVRR